MKLESNVAFRIVRVTVEKAEAANLKGWAALEDKAREHESVPDGARVSGRDSRDGAYTVEFTADLT